MIHIHLSSARRPRLHLMVILAFLLLGVSQASATSLAPMDALAFGQKIGSISVQTNTDVVDGMGNAGTNGDIEATFTPTPSMNEAAKQAWGIHFNWLNIVRSGTANTTPDDPHTPGQQRAPFPFVDPLDGGNLGFGFNLPDDDKPFYWNATELQSGTTNKGKPILNANRLIFFDRPNNDPNVMWTFETYLVSVPFAIGSMGKERFHVLKGFTWKFNEDAGGNNSITNLAFINPNLTSINQVLDLSHNFPNWTASGATDATHVPIPSTLLLFGAGFGCFIAWRWRADRSLRINPYAQ